MTLYDSLLLFRAKFQPATPSFKDVVYISAPAHLVYHPFLPLFSTFHHPSSRSFTTLVHSTPFISHPFHPIPLLPTPPTPLPSYLPPSLPSCIARCSSPSRHLALSSKLLPVQTTPLRIPRLPPSTKITTRVTTQPSPILSILLRTILLPPTLRILRTSSRTILPRSHTLLLTTLLPSPTILPPTTVILLLPMTATIHLHTLPHPTTGTTLPRITRPRTRMSIHRHITLPLPTILLHRHTPRT